MDGGLTVIHLHVPDYLSTLFLKILCGVESPDARAALSSVSVRQCSFVSRVSLLVPAFPWAQNAPSFFFFFS